MSTAVVITACLLANVALAARPEIEGKHLRSWNEEGKLQFASFLQTSYQGTQTGNATNEPVEVAVVGSGPLTEHDRELINNAAEVYRFNSMPNLQTGERVGQVFLRRDGWFGDKIWGLAPSSGACPRVTEADDVILIVNGQGSPVSEHKLAELRKELHKVDVADESCTHLTFGDKTYSSEEAKANSLFSTGFIGLSHVLKNSPLVKSGSKLHIFGMNWKKESVHSGGHPFDLEKKVLSEQPQIVVHDTDAYFYKPRDAQGHMLWSCEHDESAERVSHLTSLLSSF